MPSSALAILFVEAAGMAQEGGVRVAAGRRRGMEWKGGGRECRSEGGRIAAMAMAGGGR